MNEEPQIIIIPGKELSPSDIQIINEVRLQEFGSTTPINPQPHNEDWTKIYFLAKKGESLMAFGRLHDVDVTFENKIYHILGIATVVALEKERGYGKILMAAMKNYIQKTKKTGIGFCNKTITPFYEKCGFEVLVDGQKRFYHPKTPRFKDSDVIYVTGEDGLIEKMLQKQNEFAHISRPHW